MRFDLDFQNTRELLECIGSSRVAIDAVEAVIKERCRCIKGLSIGVGATVGADKPSNGFVPEVFLNMYLFSPDGPFQGD